MTHLNKQTPSTPVILREADCDVPDGRDVVETCEIKWGGAEREREREREEIQQTVRSGGKRGTKKKGKRQGPRRNNNGRKGEIIDWHAIVNLGEPGSGGKVKPLRLTRQTLLASIGRWLAGRNWPCGRLGMAIVPKRDTRSINTQSSPASTPRFPLEIFLFSLRGADGRRKEERAPGRAPAAI